LLVLLDDGGAGGFAEDADGGALEDAEAEGETGPPPGASSPQATAAPPIAKSVHVPKPKRRMGG